MMEGDPDSSDRLLALHVLRRLIVTQGYEFRVAQMVHVGPVRVLDPARQAGASASGIRPFCRRSTLTHLPLSRWGRFEKGQVLISSLWNRSKTFTRSAGTKSGPDARNVDEVVALIVATMIESKFFGAGT